MHHIIKICCIAISLLSVHKISLAITDQKDKAATIFCNLIEKSPSQRAQLFLSIIERYYSLSLPYDTSLQQHEILNKIITTILQNDITIFYDKLNESLLKLLIIIMNYDSKEEFFASERAIEKCVNCLTLTAYIKKSITDDSNTNSDLYIYCYAYFELFLDPIRLGLSSIVLQQQVETFIKKNTEEIMKSLVFSGEYIELSKHYITESVRCTIKDLILSKASLMIDTQLYHLLQNKVLTLQANTQMIRQEVYQKFEQALKARLDNNISVTDILLDSAIFTEKLILESLTSVRI